MAKMLASLIAASVECRASHEEGNVPQDEGVKSLLTADPDASDRIVWSRSFAVHDAFSRAETRLTMIG
jgi:hypothetical protein